MKDRELNEILKRAQVPEREADYWERFPGQVAAEIEHRRQHPRAGKSTDAGGSPGWTWAFAFHSLARKPALALGLAAFCLLVGFVLGSWKGQRPPGTDPQFAEARKYFHELEALFPNQLQAIVFDQQGTHLMLAPEPNLPSSPPLYLTVRGPQGCQRYVTFSGQQIPVNGDVCDVLVDRQGHVLVVGRETLWSDAKGAARSGPYQVEARALEATL
jgi:hypothetical protein